MRVGKLDNELLEKIVLKNIKFKHPDVLNRSAVGEDCAVVSFGDYDCILSTDPITAAINEIGRLAIHISCNDIASNGVKPLGIMLAMMLPEGTTIEEIDEIMRQAGDEAERLGVEIIGGHTEITNAVVRPVIVSTAIGKSAKNQSISTSNISVGQAIIMTKHAGLEGTCIIVSDYKNLLEKVLSKDEFKDAENMIKDLSVVIEGIIGGQTGATSMHDITEGGVLGAVWEICKGSNKGATIFKEKIPVRPVTKKISEYFNIDYLKLISSGSMLIVLPKEKVEMLIFKLKEQGVLASEIGEIKNKEDGILLLDNGESFRIDPPKEDELYKILDYKLKKEKLNEIKN